MVPSCDIPDRLTMTSILPVLIFLTLILLLLLVAIDVLALPFPLLLVDLRPVRVRCRVVTVRVRKDGLLIPVLLKIIQLEGARQIAGPETVKTT